MVYGTSARSPGTARSNESASPISTPVEAIWGLLTSVRLALALILAIAALSFVGAALMQAPPPALSDPAQYELWLDVARAKYGIWTGLFDQLQFFRVFSSVWFKLLLVLLSANILVCTTNRTPRLWAQVRRAPEPRVGDGMFDKAPLRSSIETTDVSADAARQEVTRVLRRKRFHVREVADEGTVHLVAEKNKYVRLGTLAHHAGLIVVLLGVIWGGRGGFHESQFIIPEGDVRAVGHDTGLSIRLDSFVDEYYAGGGGIPKDYRSNIVLLRDGEEVKSGTVQVNKPVVFDGVRVHQAFYGPAIEMLIVDPENGPIFNAPVPLSWRAEERPAGSFTVPELGIEVFVIAPASAFIDEVIRPGEVRLEIYPMGGTAPLAMQNINQGELTTIGGLEWAFIRESRFTGLQVVKDPGLPLVWLGSAIVVIGAMAVLNFPHRRLWARIEPTENGTQVRLAAPKERGLPFDLEFKRIAKAVEQRVRTDPDTSAGPTS